MEGKERGKENKKIIISKKKRTANHINRGGKEKINTRERR